jgi:hypothetical protein
MTMDEMGEMTLKNPDSFPSKETLRTFRRQ